MTVPVSPLATHQNDKKAFLLSLALGVGFWVIVMVLGQTREAWDSPLYWTMAYPASILCSGVLGYGFPYRPWRWGYSLMLAQAVVLVATASSFTMLPLGLITFSVLSLPLVAFGELGAWWKKRQS